MPRSSKNWEHILSTWGTEKIIAVSIDVSHKFKVIQIHIFVERIYNIYVVPDHCVKIMNNRVDKTRLNSMDIFLIQDIFL